jgi:hypothetical protein
MEQEAEEEVPLLDNQELAELAQLAQEELELFMLLQLQDTLQQLMQAVEAEVVGAVMMVLWTGFTNLHWFPCNQAGGSNHGSTNSIPNSGCFKPF